MGYRLRPFTLGHALLFDRLGLAESIATGPEVALAAKLCTMPPRKARAWLDSRTLGIRLWWIGKTREAWMRTPEDVQRCVDAFKAYLDEWTRIPTYRSTATGDGPEMGTPFPQHLRVILLARLNYRPDEVEDVPFARALWDYVGIMEAEGHLTVRAELDAEGEAAIFRQAQEFAAQVAKEQEAKAC